MTGLKEMEKMEELVIGIDLCDTYTKICCFEEEKAWTVPTVICKKKETDQWFVGKEAYGLMLTGTGVMVDKLVSLASKGGTATIEGVCYSAGELLERFLEKVLEFPKREYGAEKIAQLAVSLSRVDSAVIDALLKCADALKLPRQRLHIISHTEGFVYYAMSQKKEVWATQVGLFDLSDEGLFYYELKAQRGIRGMVVQAEGRPMEESFNLDILENASGARMADRILCSCGERLLQKKLFSAVFLTGKGFEKLDWAENFRKFLCSKRKVYGESELFARGAAYYAADFKRPKTAYPFACICEGRLKATVAMAVRQKEREIQLVMASVWEGMGRHGKVREGDEGDEGDEGTAGDRRAFPPPTEGRARLSRRRRHPAAFTRHPVETAWAEPPQEQQTKNRVPDPKFMGREPWRLFLQGKRIKQGGFSRGGIIACLPPSHEGSFKIVDFRVEFFHCLHPSRMV